MWRVHRGHPVPCSVSLPPATCSIRCKLPLYSRPMGVTGKCKKTIPELEDKILLEYNLKVANTLVGYNMIIGRDILEDLGIVIDFKQKVSIWGHRECPFKLHDATVETSYFLEEPEAVQQATNGSRIFLMLTTRRNILTRSLLLKTT
jgi:hypothetical protein